MGKRELSAIQFTNNKQLCIKLFENYVFSIPFRLPLKMMEDTSKLAFMKLASQVYLKVQKQNPGKESCVYFFLAMAVFYHLFSLQNFTYLYPGFVFFLYF